MLCVCAGGIVPVGAASYRVLEAEAKGGEQADGWVMRVFSLSQEGSEVSIRVGFLRESGAAALPEMDRARLTSVAGSLELDMDWRQRPDAGGMEAGAVVVGELLSLWREGAEATGFPMTLTCAPFPPVTFSVRREDSLVEAAPKEGGVSWDLDYEQAGEEEALANIPLVLRAAREKSGMLELGVAFRNGSRFGLRWQGSLSGKDARLITWEGEVLRPVEVSAGLRDGIAPKGRVWASGEEVAGTIRFPVPDALAGQEIRFSFPGYAQVNLVFDPETRTWVAAPQAKPLTADSAAEGVRAEEELFRELSRFWKSLSDALVGRDYGGYQAAFDAETGARAEQLGFVAGLGALPVTALEFHVPARQRLNSPGGQVRGMEVELRYYLAGIPRSNEFVALMTCDLERTPAEGSWKVLRMTHTSRPPFWTLGFTQVASSEHFLVFHKKNANDEENARLAIRQMERAYDHLEEEGISMGPKYAGFVIPDGADFSALTGRDSTLFSGASSATYVERDGGLRVINQALFINDFRFFGSRSLLGRQDRQITIQHELLHLALAEQTRPWTPAWLVEGVAVVFGGQMKDIQSRAPKEPQAEDADLSALSQLPTLGLGVGDAGRVLSQYLHSARAVEWILENHGRAALLSLYRAFAELSPGEWSSDPMSSARTDKPSVTETPAKQAARLRLTEAVMKEHLQGMSLAELDASLGRRR